jgi:hypothetical protein
MSTLRLAAAAVAALALTVSLAPPARAQPDKPGGDRESGVRRMEVWNGPVRSVYYFSYGTSPGEEASLRDLERAENALAVADQVQGLRALYLRNERVLAQRRGQVNPLLYGYSSEYSAELFPGVITAGFGGVGGYPYYGYGAFGNFGGGLAYPGAGALIGSVGNSLAFGVGNEGVMKNELTRGLAEATSPEAVARAGRAYDTAVARVASSDRLRTGLGWGKGDVATVSHERAIGGPVTLTLKDGKTIDGTLLENDADWITVETRTEEITLRKSEVTRITRPKREAKPDKP